MPKAQQYSHMFVNLRRRIYWLLGSIFLILILLIVLSQLNAKSQRDSAILMDTLGRQRMMTQKISKESIGIAFNYELISHHQAEAERNAALQSLTQLKGSLNESQLNFENILSQTIEGKLLTKNGVLEFNVNIGGEFRQEVMQLKNNWMIYHSAIQVVMTQSPDSASFHEAVEKIDALDDVLLSNCEAINLAVEKDIDRIYMNYQFGIVILMMGLLSVSLYTLYKLYRYLFLPLEELYSGFSEMGLSSSRDHANKKGLDKVVLEVRSLFSGMKQIMRLMEEISISSSFQESLQNIFDSFKAYIPYSYIGIALIKNGEADRLVASYGVSNSSHTGLANKLLGLTVNVKETSLGRILDSGVPRIINDYEHYFDKREINTYSRILLDNGIKSSITLPLKVNHKNIGFIFFSSNLKNIYKTKHVKFLTMVGNAIAVSFEKNIFVDDLLYSSVLALAKLAEARDEDTGTHLTRMKNYVMLLTDLLKNHPEFKEQITPQFLTDIEKFSPMHDIGKVGVPDGILLKPGKLTPEEFEDMKYHTAFGANVLQEAEANLNQNSRSLFKMGIDIAYAHHEKWDGSGYPRGLSGEAIPLAARIVSVADVLDALLSKRPYKEAFSFEDSLKIMTEGKGKHFDPRLIEVFLENIDAFEQMSVQAKELEVQQIVVSIKEKCNEIF